MAAMDGKISLKKQVSFSKILIAIFIANKMRIERLNERVGFVLQVLSDVERVAGCVG